MNLRPYSDENAFNKYCISTEYRTGDRHVNIITNIYIYIFRERDEGLYTLNIFQMFFISYFSVTGSRIIANPSVSLKRFIKHSAVLV